MKKRLYECCYKSGQVFCQIFFSGKDCPTVPPKLLTKAVQDRAKLFNIPPQKFQDAFIRLASA